MAPHNLQEEETTEFIPPCRWLGSEYFILAAIRAVIQSDPTHDNLSSQTGKELHTGPLGRVAALGRLALRCSVATVTVRLIRVYCALVPMRFTFGGASCTKVLTYVCETGKSMKGMQLTVAQDDCWLNSAP
jgi:hypothetical protein